MEKSLDMIRKEIKYLLNREQYMLVKGIFSLMLKKDDYQVDDGAYYVRTLYFDDPFNRALYEKEAGVLQRKKMRIRIYNNSRQNIRIERKIKDGEDTKKEGLSINFIEFSKIFRAEYRFLLEGETELSTKMYIEFTKNMLRPVSLVEYRREAFVSWDSSLRVSLDTELKSSYPTLDIFSENIPWKKIRDPYAILEIKYTGRMPIWVKQAVRGFREELRPFSKYHNSRIILNNVDKEW